MLFFITQTKTFVVSFLKEKICILLIQSRGRRLIKVCVIICLTQPQQIRDMSLTNNLDLNHKNLTFFYKVLGNAGQILVKKKRMRYRVNYLICI